MKLVQQLKSAWATFNTNLVTKLLEEKVVAIQAKKLKDAETEISELKKRLEFKSKDITKAYKLAASLRDELHARQESFSSTLCQLREAQCAAINELVKTQVAERTKLLAHVAELEASLDALTNNSNSQSGDTSNE